MTPRYQVGGLASGMDTMSIVDQFVALQKQPIQKVQQRQAFVRSQISALGDIASRLNSLSTAAKEVATNGVRATSITSSASTFSATADGTALPSSYTVEVMSLARAAKSKSLRFDTASSPIAGGNLRLGINGTNYDITLTDGMTLTEAVTAINAAGAPVNASIVNTSDGSFLSIVNRNTGHTVGQPASTALEITETTTGTNGSPLGLTVYEAAENAQIVLDGQPELTIEAASNTITGAVPGVTLTLKAEGDAQPLEIAVDKNASQAKLTSFINAIKNVNDRIDSLTSNTTTSEGVLAADSSLRSIKESIKRVITKTVSGSSTITSMADLGVSHTMYGQLTVDYTKFQKALEADPTAVNNIFSESTTGVYAAIKPIVENATKASTGTLRTRQDSLNKTVRRYDDQIERMNKSAENYRNQLVQQFSAMETTMSSMKAMSNYLTQQQAAMTAGKK